MSLQHSPSINSESVSHGNDKENIINDKRLPGLKRYKKTPWQYDNKYWSRDLVGTAMEQINVNYLSSKRRIANKYDSCTLYGVCNKPQTHELSLDESLHRKKRRQEYWDNIAKIAKELDLQNAVLDPSKSLKLKINEVVLTDKLELSTYKQCLRNTIKNHHKSQVEQLPTYCDSDTE